MCCKQQVYKRAKTYTSWKHHGSGWHHLFVEERKVVILMGPCHPLPWLFQGVKNLILREARLCCPKECPLKALGCASCLLTFRKRETGEQPGYIWMRSKKKATGCSTCPSDNQSEDKSLGSLHSLAPKEVVRQASNPGGPRHGRDRRRYLKGPAWRLHRWRSLQVKVHRKPSKSGEKPWEDGCVSWLTPENEQIPYISFSLCKGCQPPWLCGVEVWIHSHMGSGIG